MGTESRLKKNNMTIIPYSGLINFHEMFDKVTFHGSNCHGSRDILTDDII